MLLISSPFQVKSVFDMLAPAVGLSVGLVGQSTVAAEAGELVKSKSRMIHSFGSQRSSMNNPAFESCIDILVATPGRLMDHLKSTPGFTVEHLQFLVCMFFIAQDGCNFISKS